jgi:sporulation protein YlmC with PRC-barrel domain
VKKVNVAIVMASLTLPLAVEASGPPRQTQPSQVQPSQIQPSQMPSEVQTSQRAPGAGETGQSTQGAVESEQLIGARVKGAGGKDLGEIDAVIIGQSDGKVTHVIVGRGGLLGIGETKVVVPWSEVRLSWDRDGRTPVVSMDESVLERAPRYERRRAGGDQTTPPAASPSTSGRERTHEPK